MIKILFAITFPLMAINMQAKDVYKNERARWMKIAAETKPELKFQVRKPVATVKAVQDEKAFQGWRYDQTGKPETDLYSKNFKEVKEITLDFGRHMVGYFRFHTKATRGCQDAPVTAFSEGRVKGAAGDVYAVPRMGIPAMVFLRTSPAGNLSARL